MTTESKQPKEEFSPKIAETDEEIERCFDVMSELRPNLQRDRFVSMVRQMQSEGYRLAYLQDNHEVVSLAGYRISMSFYKGKHLYIDDLVTTADTRSKGYGKTLLSWLRTEARFAGCSIVDLDSGVQRERAHKFYFTQGFAIACYHFIDELGKS